MNENENFAELMKAINRNMCRYNHKDRIKILLLFAGMALIGTVLLLIGTRLTLAIGLFLPIFLIMGFSLFRLHHEMLVVEFLLSFLILVASVTLYYTKQVYDVRSVGLFFIPIVWLYVMSLGRMISTE